MSSMPMNRRAFFRLPTSMPVKFRLLNSGASLQGTAINLSAGGMLLESSELKDCAAELAVSQEDSVEVVFSLEDQGEMTTKGRAVWLEEDVRGRVHRIGLKFSKMDPAQSAAIERYVQARCSGARPPVQ